MIEKLRELPQYPVLVTNDQKKAIENQKNIWEWTANTINYLQLQQFGLEPLNPLNNKRLNSLQRKLIEVNSIYRFSQLKVIIVGWDLIKDKAKNNHREFFFSNPRELLAETCRQQATIDTNHVASNKGEDGGIGKLRKKYKFRNSFYRDKLEPEQTKEELEMGRDSVYWDDFLVYAIWEKKNSGLKRASFKMRDSWKDFLSAHKNLTAFVCCKETIEGCKLVFPKWDSGYAVNPQSSRRIKW